MAVGALHKTSSLGSSVVPFVGSIAVVVTVLVAIRVASLSSCVGTAAGCQYGFVGDDMTSTAAIKSLRALGADCVLPVPPVS